MWKSQFSEQDIGPTKSTSLQEETSLIIADSRKWGRRWESHLPCFLALMVPANHQYTTNSKPEKSFPKTCLPLGNVPDNAAVLVYGNKREVPGAMSASEISNKLDLTSLRHRNWQRNWHVQSSCALCGDGLHEGLDWLLKNAERM
ncbi:unnamed protein product [Thlaspi arvense]|uniref:ADP-ribosylation factor n=1 Tax=Thlaspi arvense TaxID=13288 RepID=A0AAU9RIC4_THLAR|nr:unnamed protein product [Thlaspi arvense]